MGSNSDVSAFFRLRFRNGLGTKPAGVLPFRMRVPNTFFLSLAWWLAGFQVLRCAKVCFAWGDFFSLFLVGSKSNVSAVFWLRWASTQKGWSIPETCQPSPNHCFDRPHPTLLSPLLGVGGMGGSPSINMNAWDPYWWIDSVYSWWCLQSNWLQINKRFLHD